MKRTQAIEALAFVQGANGIAPEGALGELNALFVQQQEREQREAAPQLKRLEAELAVCERRQPEAERRWRALEARTGGMSPQVALPVLAVLAAGAAVAGEGLFLAPVMDGLGVTEPDTQLLLASVLVITAGGLVKMVLHQWAEPEAARTEAHGTAARGAGLRFAITALLTFFTFTLVTALGWWRAEELVFAAGMQPDGLGGFLDRVPTLTRVTITGLTIGLPLFAAAALEWGCGQLRLAREWRRARHAPRWWVALRLVGVVGGLVALVMVGDAWLAEYVTDEGRRWLIEAAAVVSLSSAWAARALLRWERPRPQELYAQCGTQWRVERAPQRSSQWEQEAHTVMRAARGAAR